MEDIAFFEGISYILGLGDVKEFMPIPGGLLHQMFALYTSSGRFAVKILNPGILRRPGARETFRNAERMEIQLARHGLPICAALTFNGKKCSNINSGISMSFHIWKGNRFILVP